MFHVGHLNLLQRARENCDRLIVGVSTDDVVVEYKHRQPIVPFAERMAIVRAIRYVDEVVAQETMDKFAAWQHLRFNRLFHGNDWKGSAMYDEVESKLRAVGVEVIYFEYTQGVSSTALAERLRCSRNERSARAFSALNSEEPCCAAKLPGKVPQSP